MSAETPPNPFHYQASPLNNDSERTTLARELRYADGFVLMFALCNSAEERARQIAALREENHDLDIREFPLRQDTYHLLDVPRVELTMPLPDVVCVYGMENWIRSDVPPRTIPFLLNLNAGRNHFVKEFPCPLLFWVPEFLFEMIAEAAPDFFSIRSGIYVFAPSETGYTETIQRLQSLGYYETLGLTLEQKQERIIELTDLLARIRASSKERRDPLDEAAILANLSRLYYQQEQSDRAIQFGKESLEIWERTVGREHSGTVATMHHLGQIYFQQGRYDEAETLYMESLTIAEKTVGREHRLTAIILHDVGVLYYTQGRYEEAEPILQTSLAIKNRTVGHIHPDTAATLDALVLLYAALGYYNEAERICEESLNIWDKTIGRKHPNTAGALHNLAQLYAEKGKYSASAYLENEAYDILRKYMGETHPDTKIVKEVLDMIRSFSGMSSEE